MADEHQFIEDGLRETQIDEFFSAELARAGYGGMELAETPMGTQIVLKAEKPGMVIGKGGKNIRKVTRQLESQFDLNDPQIDVQEVDEPDLNAQIVADRLANALERGWYFRKAGHTTIDRIMSAGALGAEIVLSGKVTGARSRVEKFNRGYIKHNGEPAEELVDEGQGVSVMKLGTIGVTVRIIPPGSELPDAFVVADIETATDDEADDADATEATDAAVADEAADETAEAADTEVTAEETAAPEEPPAAPPEEPSEAAEEIEAEAEEIIATMDDAAAAADTEEPPAAMALTDIAGVGPAKAEALAEAGLADVAAVRAATADELAEVPGIGPALAAQIKADVEGAA
jgi:small subunit ribosomal protein S3